MSIATSTFKPKARLLLQLGDQLIRNEAVAIFELVKNCYDANSSYTKVSFIDVNVPSKGKVTIEDDGDGMDIDIIANVWMQPGTDYKEKIFLEHKDDPTYTKRLPIGEKGIGRFGAYKLGNTIEVVTKMASADTEVHFRIDWSELTKVDYLEDVEVKITERKPEYFIGDKNGTRITISNLRTTWTRGTLRETVRLINTLSTPHKLRSLDSFRVYVSDNLNWSEGLLDVSDILQQALFRAKIIMKNNVIQKFTYEFKPWDSMGEMHYRKYEEELIIMKEQVRNEETNSKEFQTIDLSLYEIGEITVYFFAYSLETSILKLGIDDKEGFKRYLAQNNGVKVYRDGMRVYDYGEKSNDWLGLDIRRVNRPVITISNNQLIGYVMLNRSESSDLIEKSNREGFVENGAYSVFEDAVLFALKYFEVQRNLDKEKMNGLYVSKRTKEPVIQRLSELRETVDSKVKESTVKQEILRELGRIEDEYNNMVETFLSSANAGISLGVAVHEMDKIVAELKQTFERPTNESVSHAKALTARLTELVKGYSLLLKGRDNGIYDMKGIVKQALFNVEFRLRAHDIELITNIDQYASTKLKCSRSISIGSITNLIDNSIWWLGYKDIKNKKIYVGLSDEINNHCTVIVADNGIGYTIPTEDAIKPFIHGRPTGTGIGLGLYIANQCMENQGGMLLFPAFNDFQIPKDFENGAITALAFRRRLR